MGMVVVGVFVFVGVPFGYEFIWLRVCLIMSLFGYDFW